MRKSIKILFAGAYGIENAGDDLPLIVMCENLKKLSPDTDFHFRVLSRHPNSWEEEQYGVKMIQNIEYSSREAAQGKWFRGLNFGDDKTDVCALREEIQNTDLLILGAGNFFIDFNIDILRGPIPLLSLYVFLAKVYNKPVMLYGFSAGPLNTEWGKDLSRWIIENSNLVTVRDLASKILIENLSGSKHQIHVLPDSTIGANPASNQTIKYICENERITKNSKKKLAIGIRDLEVVLEKKESAKAWDEIAEFMNQNRDSFDYIFIPQSTYNEDDDRETAQKFAARLNNQTTYKIIKHRYDPRELIGFYAICDATLAIRLHAAVFSAIAGTPVIAINYLPKVEGFMKSIKMEDFLIERNNISSSTLQKMLDQIEINQTAYRKILKNTISKLKLETLNYARQALKLCAE